ncbi:MAG TPA: polymerase [Cyanobacteria bacterium UBA11049]|nr:polymerase [Cyanobacteria bacterium UBA11049]
MKKLLLFEQIYVVVALLIFTGAWVPILYEITTGGAFDVNSGNSAIQIPFFAIYAIAFILAVLRWKMIVYFLIKEQIILLLVGIALVSVFWSDAPLITLRRGFALLGTTLFGVYFATRYTLKEQLQLLAWALGLAAVSSLIFSLALPAYGIMHDSDVRGAFRGVYTHKNILGQMMVMSTLVFLLMAMNSHTKRYLLWAGVGLSAALVLLSTSKGALVLLLNLLVLLPLYRALRWNSSRMLLFLIAVAIVFGSIGTLFVSHQDAVFGALGRDATLTGRTRIWDAVLDMIWQSPWLGYGYSAFWLGQEGKSAYVWRAANFQAGYSHNGFLDLWAELGLLGLSMCAISLLKSYFQAIFLARRINTADGLWPLICLTLGLLTNTTEGTLLKQNNIFWVLYVAVTISTSIWFATDSNLKVTRNLTPENVS